MMAACFYVADRKSGSRRRCQGYSLVLILLWRVFLPKLQDATSSLHMTTPETSH